MRAPVRRSGRLPSVEDAAVRVLAAHEAESAVRTLARAFRDNPLNRAVIGRGADARVRVNAAGLRPLLPSAVRAGNVRGLPSSPASASLSGVLVATPPGGHALAPARWWTRVRALLGQGLRVAERWGEVQDALQPHRPARPHWYLALLGVEPDRWGHGVGSALLRSFLADVDESGEVVWLETDRPENVAFYARAGFEVTGRLQIFGVPVFLLERPARAR